MTSARRFHAPLGPRLVPGDVVEMPALAPNDLRYRVRQVRHDSAVLEHVETKLPAGTWPLSMIRPVQGEGRP